MNSKLNMIGNVTSNSNVIRNVYAPNLPNISTFSCVISTTCDVRGVTYFKHDIDLRLYTNYTTNVAATTTRKFKLMCWLNSGAHSTSPYSLNYAIDYSYCINIFNFYGLYAVGYGNPYPNIDLDQITPNGLFFIQNTFDYITLFSSKSVNLQCMIIDFLA